LKPLKLISKKIVEGQTPSNSTNTFINNRKHTTTNTILIRYSIQI